MQIIDTFHKLLNSASFSDPRLVGKGIFPRMFPSAVSEVPSSFRTEDRAGWCSDETKCRRIDGESFFVVRVILRNSHPRRDGQIRRPRAVTGRKPRRTESAVFPAVNRVSYCKLAFCSSKDNGTGSVFGVATMPDSRICDQN